MERPSERPPSEQERGEQNELGFYDADEEATYDERAGEQGEPGDDTVERTVDEP